MLDDLRNSAALSFEEESPPDGDSKHHRGASDGMFLGMTAPQRFVIALMLFFMVCILGAFALLVFEKIWIPIY